MMRTTRRRFLGSSVAGGLAVAMSGRRVGAAPWARVLGANDDLRLAVIGLGEVGGVGVGGRGKQLIDIFRKVSGARIVAICDVDTRMLERERQRFAKWQVPVKCCSDMRKVFDDPQVDAVVVATPNHWHVLATVWACQAGKDVYVEKPASYSIWEGRQMLAAARKHGRIVQVGTQSRSADVSIQAAELLRGESLGAIQYAHAVVYRRRTSIGKTDGPQPVPPTVDLNLWLGPAPEVPPWRKNFHYDWHWQWPTGNGEIGNNGVHQLDLCRMLLRQDRLPERAISVGGRFLFDDDGETPNTQIALLDSKPAPIICEVRGLPAKTGSDAMDTYRSLGVGFIIQCADGALIGSRQGVVVQDNEGREIKRLEDRTSREQQGIAHQVNFLDAVRSRKVSDLHADVQEGHRSAALCHMANVSYRLGAPADIDDLVAATQVSPQLRNAWERFQTHLAANGVELNTNRAVLGARVTLDPDSEKFVGDLAERANTLSRRAFRRPFVVPEIV